MRSRSIRSGRSWQPGASSHSCCLPTPALNCPRLTLSGGDLEALSRGQVVRLRGPLPAEAEEGGITRVVDDEGRLVAMARLQAGRIHPDKVFAVPDR